MAKIQEEEHILIAVRGSLNEEVRVETIKISEKRSEERRVGKECRL